MFPVCPSTVCSVAAAKYMSQLPNLVNCLAGRHLIKFDAEAGRCNPMSSPELKSPSIPTCSPIHLLCKESHRVCPCRSRNGRTYYPPFQPPHSPAVLDHYQTPTRRIWCSYSGIPLRRGHTLDSVLAQQHQQGALGNVPEPGVFQFVYEP